MDASYGWPSDSSRLSQRNHPERELAADQSFYRNLGAIQLPRAILSNSVLRSLRRYSNLVEVCIHGYYRQSPFSRVDRGLLGCLPWTKTVLVMMSGHLVRNCCSDHGMSNIYLGWLETPRRVWWSEFCTPHSLTASTCLDRNHITIEFQQFLSLLSTT